MDPIERQRQKELQRLIEEEKKDLEVEKQRGPRPLEGFAGGHTSWTGDQDDQAAATEHAEDARKSLEASEKQAEGNEIEAEQINFNPPAKP
jgi:hypothetical protein